MSEHPRPFLSIVIPAYNEERRLPSTLDAVLSFLSEQDWTGEVIVADDGSTDATALIVEEMASSDSRVRLLRLNHQGKASAVRAGMLAGLGEHIMFIDADLPTPLSYVGALTDVLQSGAHVAFGSREGVGAKRHGEPFYRHAMGRVFNAVVRLLAVPGVNDTQCGFKAFRADAALDIFSSLRLYDGTREIRGPQVTGFDVEVLFVARKRGYTLVEVPVEWTHVPGSKVVPLTDSVRMFFDVVRVRYNDVRGRYE